MASVEDHYERFLAGNYTWMSGGHERQVAKNRSDFMDAGIVAGPGAKALDLGCGSGYQSLALAEMGFAVVAVDTSTALLDELRVAAGERPVTAMVADMRDATAYSGHGPFDVAVCMGDTLVHLQSVEDVAALFTDVFANLRGGGKFVLSFRDLSAELTGTDRILPVRLDEGRLMAVFLEYDRNHVTVNDVLFKRDGEGWKMSKSAYQKLRLPVGNAVAMLSAAGFHDVSTSADRWGFVTILARKQ